LVIYEQKSVKSADFFQIEKYGRKNNRQRYNAGIATSSGTTIEVEVE
jgi:hypothetical protein